MQNNVNAQCVIDKMVYYFGEDNVQTCDGGIVKLQVKEFSNDIKYVTDCLVYANVEIKRGGKGLTILFIPRVDEGIYNSEIQKAINTTWNAVENDLWAEQRPISKSEEFGIAAKPLMELMSTNYHPHVKAIVDSERAELVEGLIMHKS